MPIIFLEVERLIQKIHDTGLISFRRIIYLIDAEKKKGLSEIEATKRVAERFHIETEKT